MSAAFLAFAMGLGQGFLHGLGPDHCAALATLGRGAKGRSVGVALRFAMGHAIVLGALAAICLFLGVGLSETFERWAEVFGGGVLIALALAALFFPGSVTHGHPHFPPHGEDHEHLPASVGAAAGALMAISGVRALMLALPPLVIGGSFAITGWTYLPGFALGVLASMSAFGWAWSAGLARLGLAGARWVHRGVALASAGIGAFWIATRL